MKIHFLEQVKDTNNSLKKKKSKTKISLMIFFLISFIVALLFIFSTDKIINYIKLKGIQGPPLRSNPVAYIKAIPIETIKSFSSFVSVKDMNIDIKFLEFEKLRNFRNTAIKNGVITQNLKQYVNGSINYDGKRTKVKIRLKGDFIDHLIGNKWSYRVKVKDDSYINGLGVFSIQNPQTKDFQGQMLIYKMLREYDIITPRISFVNLIVNGDSSGLMMISEHFNKDLLEHSGRKEGVILKLDETSLWEGRRKVAEYYETENQVMVSAFSQSKVDGSEKLSKEYKIAAGLLRGFLEGKLIASEVFDVKLMADFLAIHDLWADAHAEIWHNFRFYYNAYTGRLEPIANDEMLYHPHPAISASPLAVKIRDDKYIHLAYINTLKELQKKIEDKKYLAEFFELDQQYESLLRSEFFLKPPPLMRNTKLSDRAHLLLNNYTDNMVNFVSNDDNLSWIVNPNDPTDVVNLYSIEDENQIEANLYVNEFERYGLGIFGLNDGFHGYRNIVQDSLNIDHQHKNYQNYLQLEEVNIDDYHKLANVYFINNDIPKLQIQNFTPYSLEIKSINFQHKKNNKVVKAKIDISNPKIIVKPKNNDVTLLNSKRGRALVSKEFFKNINLEDVFSLGNYEDIQNIQIAMTILGDDNSHNFDAVNYVETLSENPIPNSSIKAQINKHNFLTFDSKDNIIKVKEGVWNVTQPIIVPPGFKLLIDKKVTLLFNQNSYILSHGKLEMLGVKDSPIILSSENSGQYWGGVTIIGNSELPESILKNVHIDNTSKIKENGWSTNAGFLGYQIQVIMDNVAFNGNTSEDALNIVNSEFYLNNINMKNAVSDGIDSDFSKGEIVNSIFSNIGHAGGGDALDFSGSEVALSNLAIRDIGDKGLSVGENSNVDASELKLADLSVAVAIKDGSSLNLSNSEIDSAEYAAVMAYTKKKSYGGARAELNNVNIINTNVHGLSDLDSIVYINKKQIKNIDLQVEELYETIMKKSTTMQ